MEVTMTKKDEKKRTITFYSNKNKQIISVRSESAKRFALTMEKDDTIDSYETNVILDAPRKRIDTTGFRRSTLTATWMSDFMVVKKGVPCIIEIVEEEQLEAKRSCSEKLELSRRYWKSVGISQWMVVIMKRGETAW